jgi:hypothetical protein
MVKACYQSIHYEVLHERKVRRNPIGSNITFSERDSAARANILDYFEEMSIERSGILHGEYLLHSSGLLLVDRKGITTASCISLEDHRVTQHLNTESRRPEFTAHIRELLDNWDQLQSFDSLPVLCDLYCRNYFHFSLEMVPRARFFPDDGQKMVIVSQNSLGRPFQRDLLTHSLSDMSFLPLSNAIRVRDPILAHDSLSDEGIFWLRQASRISAKPGQKRIYIRRGANGTRSPGGGISESAGFEMLLRDFGFETVDFGDGENGVAAQVAMLEGVGLILTAHGAALTNLAYLNPKLTVIEVMGPTTQDACFMHVAATLGFEYHGLFSSTYDDRLDIVVDLDELYDIVRQNVSLPIRSASTTTPSPHAGHLARAA